MSIFNLTLEILIKGQEYAYEKYPISIDSLPKWVYNLCSCVKEGNDRICILSIAAYMKILENSSTAENHAAMVISASLLTAKETNSSMDGITNIVIKKLWENLDLLSQEKTATNQIIKLNIFAGKLIKAYIKKS